MGLARLIAKFAHSDGDYATAIPALSLHRRHGPTEPLHCIFNLGLGFTAQGDKQVMVADEVIDYGPGESMLTTIDLPLIARVTRASVQQPFLGLVLKLDSQFIIQAAVEMQLPSSSKGTAYRPISIAVPDDTLLGALLRLVKLLEEPALVEQLAPLVQREIVIRLLAGSHGPQLQQLAASGSPNQQIAKAVAWLRQHFRRAFQVDDLAARFHMSPSTFRQHFRAITGTSPLQYQKQLRLQEARQLMLSQNLDAGNASGLVGYESASQFSREYRRLFGAPPQQDMRRLRPNG
jgi:AraC-like DNA-binding protein